MEKSIISEITVTPIKPKDGLIGFINFVIDGKYYLGGIAIHTLRKGGYRLLFPTKKLTNGLEVEIFHPISQSAYAEVMQAVEPELNRIFGEIFEKGVEYGKSFTNTE